MKQSENILKSLFIRINITQIKRNIQTQLFFIEKNKILMNKLLDYNVQINR